MDLISWKTTKVNHLSAKLVWRYWKASNGRAIFVEYFLIPLQLNPSKKEKQTEQKVFIYRNTIDSETN